MCVLLLFNDLLFIIIIIFFFFFFYGGFVGFWVCVFVVVFFGWVFLEGGVDR